MTQKRPKPLLTIGDKPILEITLEALVRAGFRRFFISTHYLPEMIEQHFGDGSRWGASISYIHEEVPLGTGGALGLLPHDELDVPLIMMNGDLLTTMNHAALLDFHEEHGGIATVCVREYEHQIPYGVVLGENRRIRALEEKPVQQALINAGIYALSPEFVRRVSPGTRIDMPILLQQAIADGLEVTMFAVNETSGRYRSPGGLRARAGRVR